MIGARFNTKSPDLGMYALRKKEKIRIRLTIKNLISRAAVSYKGVYFNHAGQSHEHGRKRNVIIC
jgi:hypothetical protein